MAPPTVLRAREKDAKMPVYTAEEVAKHCTDADLWVTIRGGVYNLTAFLKHHPGGRLAILNVAGRDATGPFYGYHPEHVIAKRLPHLQIGVLKGYRSEGTLQEDLLDAQEQLRKEGRMETSMQYYLSKLAWQTALFCVALGLLVVAQRRASFALYMASAAVLGVFWQQLAFVGHDFGHNSVFHNAAWDGAGGILVTAFFGVSGQWWRRNHNVHHIVTNSIEHDPDIQHMPVLAVSDKLFKGYWSTYYEKFFTFDAAARLLVPFQTYLYIPVMCVARFNLYAQSWLLVLNTKAVVPHRSLEVASLVVFWAWFLCLLFTTMPSFGVAVAYLLVSHAIAGVTHVQITISHFAMPAYNGTGYDIHDASAYAKTQFATTMNVECPVWLDWLHGGLQFQVEHHLMPRVPRHNLRYAMEKYVRPLAAKHGVKYHTHTFTDCLGIVLGRLSEAAAAARKYPSSDAAENFLTPLLNAEG